MNLVPFAPFIMCGLAPGVVDSESRRSTSLRICLRSASDKPIIVLLSITAQCREQMCEIGYVNRQKMSIKLLQRQIYVQDYQFFGYFEGLNTRFRTNGPTLRCNTRLGYFK